MDQRLADLLRRTYEGEVFGAELFEQLAAAEPDPDRRERLIAAQLLEEQTREAAARARNNSTHPLPTQHDHPTANPSVRPGQVQVVG